MIHKSMSTRSVIASTNNGITRAIYCHFDGYPSHVGAILDTHYLESAKIDALIALGDLSSLGERVAPDEGEYHSYEQRAPGVTTAYHRDRGEDLHPAGMHDPGAFMKSPPDRGQDYTYLHDGEKWLVRCGRGWRSVSDVLADETND